jgi:hypothetical protein
MSIVALISMGEEGSVLRGIFSGEMDGTNG